MYMIIFIGYSQGYFTGVKLSEVLLSQVNKVRNIFTDVHCMHLLFVTISVSCKCRMLSKSERRKGNLIALCYSVHTVCACYVCIYTVEMVHMVLYSILVFQAVLLWYILHDQVPECGR